MRKLKITKSELMFADLQSLCSNKVVADIVSKYAKNEIHFYELYEIGTKKWTSIQTSQSINNINKFGPWIIKQEILQYTCH